MSNGRELKNLREFCEQNRPRVDFIMEVLSVAGFDDRCIDYVSDGLWHQKQQLIGQTWKGCGQDGEANSGPDHAAIHRARQKRKL